MLAIYYNGLTHPGGGFGMGMAAHQWWFTQSKVIFLYLKLAVWPWPLVIHYEVPILKSVAEAWPWVLGTALLAVGTLWLLWRRSAVGFVAIWFFAVLSPTLLIPLPGETAVERRMYVPLAAIVPLLHRWRIRSAGTCLAIRRTERRRSQQTRVDSPWTCRGVFRGDDRVGNRVRISVQSPVSGLSRRTRPLARRQGSSAAQSCGVD